MISGEQLAFSKEIDREMREKSLLPGCCNNSIALQTSGLNRETVVTSEDYFFLSVKKGSTSIVW